MQTKKNGKQKKKHNNNKIPFLLVNTIYALIPITNVFHFFDNSL